MRGLSSRARSRSRSRPKVSKRARTRSPLLRPRSRSPSSRQRSRTPKALRSHSPRTPPNKHSRLRSRTPARSPHSPRSPISSSSSHTPKVKDLQLAKMSETSLFAELVKDKNMRELAMKRLAAIKEKKKENKDSEPEENTPVKEVANTEPSQPVPLEVDQSTYITPSDVNNIPIPCSDSVQPAQASYAPVPTPANFVYPPAATVTVPTAQVPPTVQQALSSTVPGSSAIITPHQIQVTAPPPSNYPNPTPSASVQASSAAVVVLTSGQQTAVKFTPPKTIITILDNNMDISPVHENSDDVSVANTAPEVIHIDPEPPVVKPSVSEPVAIKPKPVNVEVEITKPPVAEVAPTVLKPKSLTNLPMPPGIRQSDFESIDSPPSHSPSPEPVLNRRKTPPRKGIRDLPMPPGKCL